MDPERFANLLRPIRDAALAFEVDVSAELEEYIEQCVRHMDESHVLNFAQAGLLVQGSAMILGRKVEHLHALVYKVLGNMRNRRENNNDEENNQEENNNTRDENDVYVNSSLALVDSELNLGKNIDLNIRQNTKSTEKDRAWSSRELAEWFFEADEAATPFEGFMAVSGGGGLYIADVSQVFDQLAPQEDNFVDIENQEEELPPPIVAMNDDDEQIPPPIVAMNDDDEQIPPQEPVPMNNDDPIPESEEIADPYAELDPHCADTITKPLRKGRSWAKPRFSIERRPEEDVDVEAALACARVASAARGHANLVELARIARTAIDRRATARRNDKFKRFNMLIVHDDHDDDDQSEQDDTRNFQNTNAGQSSGIAEEDDNDIAPPVQYDDDQDDMPPPVMMDYDQDDDLPLSPEGNDRRVSMASSTMSCATISRLARRVAAWQEHLEPILKMREERAPYDAQAAGIDLATALKEHGRKVAFAAVAQDLPRFEVCRRFCAALQLANEGKLRLSHPNSANDIPDATRDFCLALIGNGNEPSSTSTSQPSQLVAPSGTSVLESIHEAPAVENQSPPSFSRTNKRVAPLES